MVRVMETAKDILAEVQKRNIRIIIDGDRLRYRGSKAVMPTDLKEQVMAHKKELLGLVIKERTLEALDRLISETDSRRLNHAKYAVADFMDGMWMTSQDRGWSAAELFACHPRPSALMVRYDYAGPVTMAAISTGLISEVAETEVTYDNGLKCRKQPPKPDARTIWSLVQ